MRASQHCQCTAVLPSSEEVSLRSQHSCASRSQTVINHNNNHNEDDVGLSRWARHHGNGTPRAFARPGSWPPPRHVPTPTPGSWLSRGHPSSSWPAPCNPKAPLTQRVRRRPRGWLGLCFRQQRPTTPPPSGLVMPGECRLARPRPYSPIIFFLGALISTPFLSQDKKTNMSKVIMVATKCVALAADTVLHPALSPFHFCPCPVKLACPFCRWENGDSYLLPVTRLISDRGVLKPL